ncbi:hypothetical protein GCM10011583_32250 [Streptomyces camponoticapitis]|uniref:Secreted protein n=1 Tax=Streptomyces camponoticapitis TaxID=1616125 RepID=A0ABQ2E7G2_9ACTN|nr:hypothetical protein [Streptomyces camponoticapitis]GGJ98315.1 hypothetical protein GCM10011583_32250 [Streptomyces camponoticapitis]
MSTVLIVVAVIVVIAVAVGAVLYATGRGGGRAGLKRRFGPEYDRTVNRHNGDVKAAENELTERVKRHGDFRPRPLPAEARDQYVAHWAGLQERFVDSPRQAVTEAEKLISRLATDRGFPDVGQRSDHLDALSVHHAHQVDGYRRVHHAASEEGRDASTEELREAMVEARQLFERLVLDSKEDTARERRAIPGRNPALRQGSDV